MSENTNTEVTQETPARKTILNDAVEAVMNLIDALSLFATITRGALGTRSGLCCEVAPSSPTEIYLDKNQFIPLDLTINGKHEELETLSNDMNRIHEALTMYRTYPSGDEWEIVDITTITEPQIIGRDENNLFIMASNIAVKINTLKGVN